MGYPGTNVIASVLVRGDRKKLDPERRRCDHGSRGWHGARTGFQPRKLAARSQKRQGSWSSPRPPGSQDFGSGKLISDFWLQNYKRIICVFLSHQVCGHLLRRP